MGDLLHKAQGERRALGLMGAEGGGGLQPKLMESSSILRGWIIKEDNFRVLPG